MDIPSSEDALKRVATLEINEGVAGSNYGWPTCQGPCSPTNPNFRDPIYWYGHTGGNCAVVGAAFYNPSTQLLPSTYVGKYFFADYCAGWLRALDPDTRTVTNFATIKATNPNMQADGVYIRDGGRVVNGSGDDHAALITAAARGVAIAGSDRAAAGRRVPTGRIRAGRGRAD